MLRVTGYVEGVLAVGFIPSARRLIAPDGSTAVLAETKWIKPDADGLIDAYLFDNTQLTGKKWWWLVTERSKGSILRFVIGSDPGQVNYADIRPGVKL